MGHNLRDIIHVEIFCMVFLKLIEGCCVETLQIKLLRTSGQYLLQGFTVRFLHFIYVTYLNST